MSCGLMTQLTKWTGPKQIRQPVSNGLPPRRLAVCGALALIVASVGQTACESTRSYERASDGSTVFLDELSDATKTDARQKIVASLTRGVEVYDLAVGDEVEIFFHIERKPTVREYLISVADKLRVEFLAETENSRTVQVRPDGRISMPLIGPVMAAGQTVESLAHQLQERYSGILTRPQITIDVTEAHSPLEDFIQMLGSSTKGRSIVDKVLPDGTISVPLLPPLKAGGRSLRDLQNEIDAYIGDDGVQRVRSINLRDVMEDLKFEQDMIVPNNSIIYVPPTEMAKLGRFEDALLRDILRYNGANLSGAIILNNPSGSTVVPTR